MWQHVDGNAGGRARFRCARTHPDGRPFRDDAGDGRRCATLGTGGIACYHTLLYRALSDEGPDEPDFLFCD